ncbi:hypothetical protein GZH53_09230 [Flavihumibacter sp. R14]|nr:hypothetical protein [Flavihumibacter soli]
MNYLQKILFFSFSLIYFQPAKAQIEDPVKISTCFERLKGNEGYIVVKAEMPAEWHIYSQFLEELFYPGNIKIE